MKLFQLSPKWQAGMNIKRLSVRESKELLDSQVGYLYLDVRSEAEFQQGHPEGAMNIPLKQMDPGSGMLVDNPDFTSVVEVNLAKDGNFLVGCAVGQRSFMACSIMAQLGYKDLVNVEGGFGGAKDMFGNLLQEGWLQLGYPVSTGDGGANGYPVLAGKTATD